MIDRSGIIGLLLGKPIQKEAQRANYMDCRCRATSMITVVELLNRYQRYAS